MLIRSTLFDYQGCGQQGDCDGLSSLVKELKSSEGCKLDRIAYGVIIDAFLMTETSSGFYTKFLMTSTV